VYCGIVHSCLWLGTNFLGQRSIESAKNLTQSQVYSMPSSWKLGNSLSFHIKLNFFATMLFPRPKLVFSPEAKLWLGMYFPAKGWLINNKKYWYEEWEWLFSGNSPLTYLVTYSRRSACMHTGLQSQTVGVVVVYYVFCLWVLRLLIWFAILMKISVAH